LTKIPPAFNYFCGTIFAMTHSSDQDPGPSCSKERGLGIALADCNSAWVAGKAGHEVLAGSIDIG
jgi:hypothetical protein